MQANWTPSSVKAELPQVTVKSCGVTYVARLSGRLNAFATVTLIQPLDTIGKRPGRGCMVTAATPLFCDYKYTWETIARALNAGHALTL